MIKPTLNDEQQAGHDAIASFLHEPHGNSMFLLKGYAGTGKTFLISHIINQIIEANSKAKWYKQKKIAMTAPTNKAVQVLRESSGLADLVSFKTIHSLLGLKEVIKDFGEIEYKKAYDEDDGSMSDFHIVIIDEVSMLDDALFYEVKRWNSEIKIIMMGDPAQIPPVNKVDCEPFLRPKEHEMIEFQLTQIMRQEDGSAIVSSSFDIRENLHQEGTQ